MAYFPGSRDADSLVGTSFDDFMQGYDGADTLRGGLGSDTLIGGADDDLIEGGRGSDRLSGGSGSDTFVYTSILDLAGDRIADFGPGDRIDVGAFPYTWGSEYPFSGQTSLLRYGATTIDNGTVAATVIEFDLDGDTLADASIFLVGLHRLTISHEGIVRATDMNLRGTSAGETLVGGDGQDTVRGFEGADSLIGGNGNDRLLGGDGADTLNGTFGVDILIGGAGDDVFQFSEFIHLDGDRVRDMEAGDRIVLALSGLEFIGDAAFTGLAGEVRASRSALQFDMDGDLIADRFIYVTPAAGGTAVLEETAPGSLMFRLAEALSLVGTDAAETLTGGAGADSLRGLGGADSLAGGSGNDTIEGGSGDDTLLGGTGADILRGEDGNDLLIGSEGRDTLIGGAGVDRFLYLNVDLNVTVGGRDTIEDFAPGTGEVIDLSLVDANIGALGDQSFTFIGRAAFTAPGQLRFANGVLQGNTAGTTGAEFTILLTGVTSLAATDLIL